MTARAAASEKAISLREIIVLGSCFLVEKIVKKGINVDRTWGRSLQAIGYDIEGTEFLSVPASVSFIYNLALTAAIYI